MQTVAAPDPSTALEHIRLVVLRTSLSDKRVPRLARRASFQEWNRGGTRSPAGLDRRKENRTPELGQIHGRRTVVSAARLLRNAADEPCNPREKWCMRDSATRACNRDFCNNPSDMSAHCQ